MVKKDPTESPVNDLIKESENTEDSNIEHINKLINKSDEESFVISEDEKSYKTVDKEQDTKSPIVEQKHAEKVSEKHNKRFVTKPNTKPLKKGLERAKMIKKVEHKKVEVKSKVPKSRKQGSKMVWLWVGIAVVVLLIIAVVLFANKYANPVNNPTTNQIAATVNGEPIYMKDINDQYDALNPLLQQSYTKESILNQSIDELLLLQEAKNLNIQVSDTELQAELQNFKTQNQLTDTQLNDILKQQNITMKQLEDLITKRIMVRDLLNQTILNNITVTSQEIQDYYNNNSATFIDPAKVTVNHILILVNDNVTDAMAKAKINAIYAMYNGSNFCDLVLNYTEDTGSKTTCGQYTFARGEMVPEFENASFDLAVGNTTIVRSMYGYHLILKVSSTPQNVMPLSNVTTEIEKTVHDVIAQKNFDAMVEQLRAKAVIVNYLAKNDTTANNTSNPVNTVTPTNPTTTTPAKNYDDFAKCLTSKGAKFYGASWCPHCANQKEMFGDSLQYVTYVECAVPGNDQIQTPECQAAGITGYPTWIINGQSYAGEQSIADLARLTGCVAP